MAMKRKGRRMINTQGDSQSSGRKPLEVPDLNSGNKTENTEPSTEEKEELEKAIDKELENQGEETQEETEETEEIEDVDGEEDTSSEGDSENKKNSDDSDDTQSEEDSKNEDNTQGEETEKAGDNKENKDSEDKDGKKKKSDDKDGEKKSESNKGNSGTSGGGAVASSTPNKDGSNDTAKSKKLDPEDLKDRWKRRGKGLKDWFINVGRATKYGLKNLGITLLKVLRRVVKIVIVVVPIILFLSFTNAVFEVYGPQYFADDCGVGNAPIFDAKWDSKKTEDAVMSYLVDSSGGDRMVGGILTEYVKATSGTKETWSSTGDLDTSYDTIDVKNYVRNHPDVRVGLFGLSGDTLIEYLDSLGDNTDWYSSDKQLNFVGKKLNNPSDKEKEIDNHTNTAVKQLTQKERIEARLGITMSGSEYTKYEKAGTERVKKYKGNTTNCKPYGHGKGFKGSGTAVALAGEFSSPVLNQKVTPANVTSWFGYRQDPTGASGPWHEGIDFGVTNVQLTPLAEGVVTAVKHDAGGYGTHVIFKLTDPKFNDATIIYGHMSRIDVHVGDHVKPGDVLGISGSTGNSSGPHLHVTLLNKQGQYVNPAGYFFGSEYANKDNGQGIKAPYDKTHL